MIAMKLPRFIPKRIFQTIALLLLALVLFLTIQWIMNDAGLYEIFRQETRSKSLAMALTFLTLFVVWFIVIVPLRMMSHMPTMKEELGADLSDGLPAVGAGIKRVYAEQEAKNEALFTAAVYTPEMTRQARKLGWGFLLAGILLTMAGLWMIVLILEMKTVFVVQILLLLAGPVLTIAGLIQLITGRSVFRK
ncbi:MAG: hypothetical protein H6667_24540 [Ardenticatenaceae bacterium]|nr:hypothetical protein [Ardenticatenaceae bacterium]MCB9444961.1 hypothetical protein [Ardenticatenaceae bacterium]